KPSTASRHSLMTQHHRTVPHTCIITMVAGQLKADKDLMMGFHQMFLLKNVKDA
ncbi:nuclear transport factor 2-like, partial [Lynx pardinus]